MKKVFRLFSILAILVMCATCAMAVRIDDCVEPGDTIAISVKIQNTEDFELKNLRITAIVDDDRLQIRERAGPFRLAKHKSAVKQIYAVIPEDTQDGQYNMMISVYNRYYQKTYYRPFSISCKGDRCCFTCPDDN